MIRLTRSRSGCSPPRRPGPCWCCRSPASSSTRSTATTCRPASTAASDMLLTVITVDSLEHGDNEPRAAQGTSASRCSRSRTRAGTGRSSRSTTGQRAQAASRRRSPRRRCHPPAERARSSPTTASARWAQPRRARWSEPLRVAEAIVRARRRQGRPSAIPSPSPARWARLEPASSPLPHPPRRMALALAGLGLLAVTLFQIRFGLLPLRADRAGPGRHPLRRGDHARRRPARRDRAAAAGAQRAAQVQPGDRRARAHAGRQPRARAEDAARRHHQRGARATSPARRARSPSRPTSCATQVNLYLDRARMAARIGVIGRVTEVRPVVESHRARAGAHLPRQAASTITVDCPAGARFQGEQQDLEEMLGNLLDNACKWARREVV